MFLPPLLTSLLSFGTRNFMPCKRVHGSKYDKCHTYGGMCVVYHRCLHLCVLSVERISCFLCCLISLCLATTIPPHFENGAHVLRAQVSFSSVVAVVTKQMSIPRTLSILVSSQSGKMSCSWGPCCSYHGRQMNQGWYLWSHEHGEVLHWRICRGIHTFSSPLNVTLQPIAIIFWVWS